MYEISSHKQGKDYHVEFKTPFERRYHVFMTYEAYKEYVSNLMWHLQLNKKDYITDLEM
ncbi:hypothetical protein [Oceanobacillus bengalensis]|uniref:hypothetical protein n=1 Tax=Oceanobacillus bengalensis TaxID=1435466 RepID=UPI00160302B3|nr:hypothetical protein [Oceanobacillus bengalensis]